MEPSRCLSSGKSLSLSSLQLHSLFPLLHLSFTPSLLLSLFPSLPQVLLDSVETKCKCHGVSGSCSVKTCWKSLLDVGQVSAQLKARYLSATKVTSRQVGTRRHLVPRDMEVRPVLESELVYLISSPDYCTSNIKHGSYGTTDR